LSYLVIGMGFILTLMLQMGVASRLPLLSGTADLILLFLAAWSLQEHVKHFWIITIIAGIFVSLISAMPLYSPLIAYMSVIGIAYILKQRVWQTPVLAMFLVVFSGTLLQQFLYILSLQVSGITISWSTSFTFVTLPSLLINMLLVIPVYAVVQDLSMRVNPKGQDL
jgi:cell shape-determining protein MreD